ncbi:MAG: isocitrate/isopropylmalate family dehydrogenase, partial [Halobacteria archaeon]|nr:isocitrate/isopropylmalate family dehydrogenase [Halobacteria archaeon]
MMSYTIPVIKGDGIGPEIVEAGQRVLEAASDAQNFGIEWRDYPFGADHYLETDEILPESALNELSNYDAIYFGSIGDPRVEPGVLEKGIILKLRFHFDQYVNLRPIKLLEGIETPLRDRTPDEIDFTVVRENTEDFYVGIGGRAKKGKSSKEMEVERNLYKTKFDLDVETDAEEIAYQIGAISREGTERVVEYAFDHAEREGHDLVTGVDKANVLTDIYGLWREVIEEKSEEYDGIDHEFNYVDAATMWFVKDPDHYQTVVTPNTFGDIVTDLGAMIQGGLGLAPGGNINPDGVSMFEPIHGSAPKHAGKNKADPLATILAGQMMLEQLGEEKAARK